MRGLVVGGIALVGLLGIALRIWTYRSTLGIPNADEAVVGLMARHVLDGELTTFYWGQAYGGSQEVLLTAPLPLPAVATVRVKVGGAEAKVAVTEVLAVRVTVQGPVPLQPPPLQPVKVEPAAGVAVRVTMVPLG